MRIRQGDEDLGLGRIERRELLQHHGLGVAEEARLVAKAQPAQAVAAWRHLDIEAASRACRLHGRGGRVEGRLIVAHAQDDAGLLGVFLQALDPRNAQAGEHVLRRGPLPIAHPGWRRPFDIRRHGGASADGRDRRSEKRGESSAGDRDGAVSHGGD